MAVVSPLNFTIPITANGKTSCISPRFSSRDQTALPSTLFGFFFPLDLYHLVPAVLTTAGIIPVSDICWVSPLCQHFKEEYEDGIEAAPRSHDPSPYSKGLPSPTPSHWLSFLSEGRNIQRHPPHTQFSSWDCPFQTHTPQIVSRCAPLMTTYDSDSLIFWYIHTT